MTDPRPTIADRYAALDPDDLTTDQLLLWGLTNEMVGLRTDVVAERADRQESFRVMRRGQRLGRIGIAVAIIVVALFGGSYIREGRVTCDTRRESSARIRSAVGAAVDEGAIQLGATPTKRRKIDQAVADRVYAEYPPPAC